MPHGARAYVAAGYENYCGNLLWQSSLTLLPPEYGRVQLKKAGNMFHDRYIVLDYDKATEKIYHCGASSKDGGNRVMTIEEVSETAIYHPLILKLLSCSQLVLN